jgi:hypothetical protein
MGFLRISMFCALLGSFGCKSDLDKYKSYVDKACACTTAACIEKVKIDLEEIEIWQLMLDKPEEMQEPVARMMSCSVRFLPPEREKTKAELDLVLLQDVVKQMCACSDLACARDVEASNQAVAGPEALAVMAEEIPFQTEVMTDYRDKCLRKLEAEE